METSFDTFWNLYDNKKSKDKCERKWYSLTAKDQQACMDSLPQYIQSTPDKQYRKHPATYLNNKSWNDEVYKKEQEASQIYKTLEQPSVSDYKPEDYQRAKAIQHMREKLKVNYENETFIKDWGDVYTTLLTEKCGMNVPESVKEEIEAEVFKIANTPRKNRFEPIININVVSEQRDRELNWYLTDCRERGIKVYEQI